MRASIIAITNPAMNSRTTAGALEGTEDRPGLAEDTEMESVDQIVARGPRGAIALSVLSVAAMLAMWLAFYFWVFLPRGTIG